MFFRESFRKSMSGDKSSFRGPGLSYTQPRSIELSPGVIPMHTPGLLSKSEWGLYMVPGKKPYSLAVEAFVFRMLVCTFVQDGFASHLESIFALELKSISG